MPGFSSLFHFVWPSTSSWSSRALMPGFHYLPLVVMLSFADSLEWIAEFNDSPDGSSLFASLQTSNIVPITIFYSSISSTLTQQ